MMDSSFRETEMEWIWGDMSIDGLIGNSCCGGTSDRRGLIDMMSEL